MRIFLTIGAIAIAVTGFMSCETMSDIGTTLGVATGQLTPEQAADINKTAKAVARSFEDITPEQEYYIGRAVGANIVTRYKPYNNQRANDYVNLLGSALALSSDRPDTYGGYHFLILDSEEINAFASPGGLIFITRGLLRLAQSEDMVAAILAHEVGHVTAKHGLQSIKQSRVTEALTSAAITGAKLAGSAEIAELTTIFEGSIEDITKNLIVNGYSREFEYAADVASARILRAVGYDPNALVEVLKIMDKTLKRGGPDFAKTHPDPKDRIRNAESEVRRLGGKRSEAAERDRRFREFIRLI